MFDITSSKLLILAIVALIVVGPKDLPVLLRTVGKYLGVVRRHAAEFRAQFDEALHPAVSTAMKRAAVQRIGKKSALPPFVEWLKRIMIRTLTANL